MSFPRNRSSSHSATFHLNQNSTQEDAVAALNSIKTELSEQIERLAELKREIIQSEQIEVAAKSKVRIAIESLLIDLNEEIFTLSEELASSFQTNNVKALISQARECELRKK